MRTREGDLFKTHDGIVFDVKGLVHPWKKIVAFPRFVPDLKGNRAREGTIYRKIYHLPERFELLEERLSHYLVFDPVFDERLCEVPEEDVKQYYNPIDRLQELRESSQLDELETCALRFVEFLQSCCGVSWSKLGISGSVLGRLHTAESDVDPIVYGAKNSQNVYRTLKTVMQRVRSEVKAYTKEELMALYNFRVKDTEVSFGDFVITEQRKVLQGKFLQRDFFVRCIRDWNEIQEHYGDVVYRKVGYAKIRAMISDDSEAIFTPCSYAVDDVERLDGEGEETIKEIASFRGRFCEQAKKGETVIAQGKVEKVQEKNGDVFFRLLLGGKASDFMILER